MLYSQFEAVNHQNAANLIKNNFCDELPTTEDGSYQYSSIEFSSQDSGFGFIIIGGQEEGTQVAVSHIIQGGAAHMDGRLRPNDEIIMIDNEGVLGATHRRVVELMTIAGYNRYVRLMVRRRVATRSQTMMDSCIKPCKPLQLRNKITQQQSSSSSSSRPASMSNYTSMSLLHESTGIYPFTLTLYKRDNEVFGFVIKSVMNENGPKIGRIIENSPAERCNRLKVGDRILAVNGIDIALMDHNQIVKIIKESGNVISVTVDAPIITTTTENNNQDIPIKFGIAPEPPSPMSMLLNSNELQIIELHRPLNSGFGFSIRGGKEFNVPLFVLKIADTGPAAQDGRLFVGDLILEINGHDALSMTHNEAIERIKAGGTRLILLIRRTGLPPPSITDILAVNSSSNRNTAAIMCASPPISSPSYSYQQLSISSSLNGNTPPVLSASPMSSLNNSSSNSTSGFQPLNYHHQQQQLLQSFRSNNVQPPAKNGGGGRDYELLSSGAYFKN